jgi:pSer/pThr/pTyr-binding forkhead associated (FHA) protein
MNDSKAGEEGHPNPEVEVETDPTVIFVPVTNRDGEPLTREQAANIKGIRGHALVVARGPKTGMTYLLGEGNTTVGRHPESDIFLNDVTVSRHHCRFVSARGILSVEDSGSTNGTYVNDTRVDAAALSAGDEVIIGRFHFLVAYGNG